MVFYVILCLNKRPRDMTWEWLENASLRLVRVILCL